MLWKELHAEGGLELPTAVKVALTIATTVGLRLAAMIFLMGLAMAVSGDNLPDFGNLWTRVVGTLALCGALLGIALRAAGALSSEREQQTLDSLLTTDLSAGEILGAKWRASFWSVRMAAGVLGAVVAAGMLIGGVFPLAVLPMAATCAASGAFAANLGLYCSLVCRTTLRATVATVVVLFGVTVGHWLVYLCSSTLLRSLGKGNLVEALGQFHTYGLTPPLTFVALTVSFRDALGGRQGMAGGGGEVPAALAGVAFYAVLASLLWWRLNARFRRLTGRRE